jgi:predicted MFS family arabinose efflux permease
MVVMLVGAVSGGPLGAILAGTIGWRWLVGTLDRR